MNIKYSYTETKLNTVKGSKALVSIFELLLKIIHMRKAFPLPIPLIIGLFEKKTAMCVKITQTKYTSRNNNL